ncbi:MAG: DUF2141 domain-containing protein [Alphaproteobacteria bacterium]|nr:DUF2141 domain-containing protein [Alphaproteobacteria bacterium]
MKNIFITLLISIIFYSNSAIIAHAETRSAIAPALQLTFLSTKSSGRIYLQIIPAQHADDFPSATSHISMNYVFDSKNPTQIVALPDGVYAISAFHDLNDDGELNSNIVGLPTEPYGFSNDARGKFGPAKFTDAQFTITADKITHLTINLK